MAQCQEKIEPTCDSLKNKRSKLTTDSHLDTLEHTQSGKFVLLKSKTFIIEPHTGSDTYNNTLMKRDVHWTSYMFSLELHGLLAWFSLAQ